MVAAKTVSGGELFAGSSKGLPGCTFAALFFPIASSIPTHLL
ncbi:hypothetical protein HBN54_001418 [Hymenobacter sp. 1B]|uniref:Uncharacterized protein n=1 Tax=Hymenobacter artigasi TaxID=2719616 RepID=A0ABX1HG37_9BACT|nr:hypothetical protein [Hymenobacter artigasi]